MVIDSTPLRSERRERFCHLVVEGKPLREAYTIAGYKHNNGNPYRLVERPDVKARIHAMKAELAQIHQKGLAKAAAKHAITVDSLLDEIEASRLAAYDSGQFAAAIAASKEKAVLAGLRIERSEQGKPHEFASMSDDALMRELEALGLRVVQTPTIEGKVEDVT